MQQFIFIQWTNASNMWWLLALLPVVFAFFYYGQWHRKLVKKLGDLRLLQAIMPGAGKKRRMQKQGLMLGAMALLCIAMLNPATPKEQAGSPISGLNVVVAIDVSKSMLATDQQPNRLELAKLFARQLIDTLQGNKVGIVAFAGEAWLQLPLTNDFAAARQLLSSVQPQSVPLEGTDIAHALEVSLNALPSADLHHKAIVLITDGEEVDGDAENALQSLKEAGITVLTVGAGTPGGASITDENGTQLRQDDGAPVVSKLNEAMLTKIAGETNGLVTTLEQPQQALAQVVERLNSLPKKPLINSDLINFYSYAHWLIALAILLLIVSALLTDGGVKKRQPIVVVLLVICLCSPVFTTAQVANQLIENADEHYKMGQLDDAAAGYKTALSQSPNAWNAHMQLGNIAYRKGQWQDALEMYKTTLQHQLPKNAAAMVYNNAGLCFAKMQQLEKAIDFFKEAIRQNPNDPEQVSNLAMAMNEWKKQQQQQPQQQNNKKQNKKQNDDQLNALQQEEKKIRKQMQQQKKTSKVPGTKNW